MVVADKIGVVEVAVVAPGTVIMVVVVVVIVGFAIVVVDED